MRKKKLIVPPRGYVTKIAEEADCTIQTVRNALQKNMPGEKADKVREIYRRDYM